jgi:Tat protein translocase TatB subunit
MFGTLGGPEILLILVIALIVFGPRRLPDIGKSLGKMMVEFRRASNDFRRTVEEEVEADKVRQSLDLNRIEAPKTTAAPASAEALAAPGAPQELAPPLPGTVAQGSWPPPANAAAEAEPGEPAPAQAPTETLDSRPDPKADPS